jgi:DNA polymerase III sliding clamp (beta) subunit (PCNA family)
MIIRREAINAVLPATNHDDTRYNLQAVQCEPAAHRIVATDGHVLLIATDNNPMQDEDFPLIPGAEFHGDQDPIAVQSGVLRSMLATMPKKPILPILACCQLSKNGSESTATLAATDLEAPRVATIKAEDLKFPNYDRILPKGERNTVRVFLAVDVLETIIKAAKAVARTGKNAKPANIAFDVPIGRSDRAKVTTRNAAGELVDGKPGEVSAPINITITGPDVTVTGLAMPCRF